MFSVRSKETGSDAEQVIGRKTCDSRRYDEHWYCKVVEARMGHVSQRDVRKSGRKACT